MTLLLLAAAATAVLVVTAWPAAAAPPQPSAGSADVDGSASEWDLSADLFVDLHKNGDPSHPVAARLYLRYDCGPRVLYALVLSESGFPLLTTDPGEVYLMIDGTKVVHGSSGDDGSPPDFQWIGASGSTADGFEASAVVGQGTHELRVHAKFPQTDPDGYETVDVVGRTTTIVLACQGVGPVNPTGPGAGAGPTAGVTAAAPADVSIAKVAKPTRIPVNDRSVFTLTVRNIGTVPATNVTVTDDLPDRVALVSATPQRGSCTGTTKIVCQLGTLAPGDVVLITIVVVGAVPGQALNVAVVTMSEADVNPADNKAEAIIEIVAPGRARDLPCYFLTASRDVLRPGKLTVLRVTVRLAGKRVRGVKVVARGAGVQAEGKSDANGVARLGIRPTRPGVIRVAAVPARPPRGSASAAGVNCGLALGVGVAGVADEKRLTG